MQQDLLDAQQAYQRSVKEAARWEQKHESTSHQPSSLTFRRLVAHYMMYRAVKEKYPAHSVGKHISDAAPAAASE